MSFINVTKAISIILTSSIFAFFIIEFIYRAINWNKEINEFPFRTMLFEAGENFINHNGYFKYYPDRTIRSLTLFSKQNPKNTLDITVEYDSEIKTNNVGLVMLRKLRAADNVAFVIGDSFTEGQGATPWFYELEQSYDSGEVKLVNLGILGTGPMHWRKLANDVTKEYGLSVRGTVINIIPADMERNIWNLKPRVLSCLHHALCDYNYGFQGYKFASNETYDDIKRKVLKSINRPIIENSNMNYGYYEKLKMFVKKSEVIVSIYEMLKRYTLNTTRQNGEALLALSDAVNGNVFVNIVSQKTVNSINYSDYPPAKNLINFLKINNINHVWCDIPADGFHINDSHPNARGYAILRNCTRKALDKIL